MKRLTTFRKMLPFFQENLPIFRGKFYVFHRKTHNFLSKPKNQGIDEKISIPEKSIDTSITNSFDVRVVLVIVRFCMYSHEASSAWRSPNGITVNSDPVVTATFSVWKDCFHLVISAFQIRCTDYLAPSGQFSFRSIISSALALSPSLDFSQPFIIPPISRKVADYLKGLTS